MHQSYDVILVQPYPFAEHPSFPEALLKRSLEAAAFSVGVIETPRWQRTDDFRRLGRPRLFFAVVSGPVDSVVLNYTSTRKRRREDQYQTGGIAFFPGTSPSVSSRIRPDRAVIVFSNRLREAFPEAPIVIGGLEASMRRFSHYDFQQEKIRRSVLFDSRADLLVAGMGERPIVEAARLCGQGKSFSEMRIPGTAMILKSSPEKGPNLLELPSHEEIENEPGKLLEMQLLLERNRDSCIPFWQPHAGRGVFELPPARSTQEEVDKIYQPSFSRMHSSFGDPSPALRMNLFSITSHRGCGGGCSFCSIQGHQGRRVVSRTTESIIREISQLARHPLWKGTISDIGGPTAEMYGADCASDCNRHSCQFPGHCGNFSNGDSYLRLLRECRKTEGVDRILVGSGLRYDTLLRNPELLEEILRFHSGRFLRIAPEHTEDPVLKRMGKPSFDTFMEFLGLFRRIQGKLKQKIEPALYLIVGHPGESLREFGKMEKKIRSLKLSHIDVQIFTPTPGTLSTAMYVSGLDRDGHSLEVEKRISELIRRMKRIADHGKQRG